MKYLNLDLEATQYKNDNGIERFNVRVSSSPAGEQKHVEAEEVTLPANLRTRLRFLEKRKMNMTEMIGLGEDLASALFPPRARLFLDRSRERIREDEGLRIRLKLDTFALADLPWEYVYIPGPNTPSDQKGPDGFLVLDRRASVVRYELMAQAGGTLDPISADSLRVVMLMADPNRPPQFPPLNLAEEQKKIEEALQKLSGLIHADFYPEATVDALEEALMGGAHVFHFSGHGKFEGDLGMAYGSLQGEGYLVLIGDDGKEALFPSHKLAMILKARGVRLAVLGACEGGRRDGVNAWTGIAPALTRAGIPAVVGMQYTIYDRNAIAFSRAFYRTLAEGQTIDAAVNAGRLAIFTRGGGDERDWGVPALYLRATDGVLFPKPVESARGVAAKNVPSVVEASASESSSQFDKVDPRDLRMAMVQAFSLEDLEVLCADVELKVKEINPSEQVNLEIVGGSGKTAKVLNLIQYLERRGYLHHLVDAVRSTRPGII